MVKTFALLKDKKMIKNETTDTYILDKEDKQILSFLDDIKNKLQYAELCLDTTNNTLLIDSLIYEIKSLEKRYDYYVRLCKEKKIVINSPNILRKFPAS